MIQEIKILEQENKKIKYIVHMADIHIHKRDREIEYRKVFETLYNDLREKKLNNNNSVIVICGDIIHDHIDLHPISVALVKDFFVNLCEITSVIVIGGNHDESKTNETHNSLFSIIGNHLKTKHNLFMLLNSGLYEYNNIIFGHTKFGDNVKVQECGIKTKKYKCALFHGIINNCIDDSGRIYKNNEDENKYLSVKDFSDYDYVFLGDIHKHSFLKKNIAYSGSLIQQTIDESLDKGYILWDLIKEKGTFCKISNEYGKVKLNIDEKGNYDLDFNKLPKKIDINIECRSMNRDHINKIYNKLTENDITIVKKYDTMINKNNSFDTKIKIGDKTEDLILLKSKEDVIDLIINKIKSDTEATKKTIDDINQILLDMFKDEISLDVCSNKKKIKLISLKFNNMAIYLEDNFIDFAKFKNIMGISAPNSEGKSAFIDCILQAIFGKNTRGKRTDMININKKSYHSEIILDVNNVRYKIIRNANRNKKANTSKESMEKIWLYENDKEISGKDLNDNKNIINEKIGSLEDFLMTSIVAQKSMCQGQIFGFAELDAKQKRDLLFKIARLDIFDKISNLSESKFKSISIILAKTKKKLETYFEYGNDKDNIKKQIETIITDLENEIETYSRENEDDNLEKDKLQKEISSIETMINVLNDKLKDIYEYDEKEYDKINDNIKTIKTTIKKDKKQFDIIKKDIDDLNTKLKKMGNITKIQNEFDNEKKQKISEIKKIIKEKTKMLWNDSQYDYSDFDKNKNIKEKNKLIERKKNLNKTIADIKSKIKDNLKIINKKIKKIDSNKIDQYREKEKELVDKKTTYEKYENEIKIYQDKYKNIRDHQYDPKCKYCMKNNITKEKIYLDTQINYYKKQIKIIDDEIKEITKYINKNNKILNDYEDYNSFIEDKKTSEQNNIMFEKDLEIQQNNILNLENSIDNIDNLLKNYEIYLNNDSIEKEINELENEMDKLINKECDKVCEYEKLKQTISVKNDEYNTYENTIDKNTNYLNKLENDIERLDSNKNNYDKNKKMFIEKNKLVETLKDKNKLFNILVDRITKTNEKLKDKTKELTIIKQKQATFNLIYDDINNLQIESDNYNILTQILKKGNGIVDIIVKNNLIPRFNTIVNNLFVKFSSRTVYIEYIGNEIIIRNNNNVDTIRDGGYQTYLNNLVYRIALSQLNNYLTTNFMIIDEAFDSADSQNKKYIIDLISYLRTQYDWILIVSHDNDIKDLFESIITIQNTGDDGRKIVFK